MERPGVTPTAPQTPSFMRLGQGTPTARQIVLVSGVEVPLFRLDLPTGLRGQAREKVARRQLTDRFGLSDKDIEMRPYLGAGTSDRWTQVLITSPQQNQSWQDLPCRAVLPDYLSLPTAPDLWVLSLDALPQGPTLLARLGPEDGFSATPDLIMPLLETALKQAKPKAILCLTPPLPQLQTWAAQQGIDLLTEASALSERSIASPQIFAHGELAGDLRKNPMAARALLSRQILPWRWPLLFGLMAAGLWGANEFIASQRNVTLTAAIQQDSAQLVQQHFVPTGPILDVRVQVSRALNELRLAASETASGPDPVELMWQVSDVVARSTAVPEKLSYRQGDGINLVIKLADFAAADQLALALQQAQLTAELRDSRASEGESGVRVEFQITAGQTKDQPFESGQGLIGQDSTGEINQ